ncbi:hypothetical protein [Polymorphobacter multimanifer]|uniref:Uncharacterized protein n=1 Tax=Polymorphobacter multimanifer TaxID=1070431 RepID=A0A841L8V1_9SPHN|nr:hypothetical protein [Polymorphobacter multimanifer]MBB6228021.1 hypothetical protein [Polymorphobacter multimanifer]
MQIGLSWRQIAILAGIGVALWYAAGLLLHWLAAAGLLQGSTRAAVYALTVPGTLPFVLLAAGLARLAPDQRLTGIAIVTTTALLIDGVVVAWFPGVYGDTAEKVLAASGAVLWGAGVGLALAALLTRSASPRPPARGS